MNNEQIDGGYILISRHILENEIWYKSPAFLKIFLYILLRVNYKEGMFSVGEQFFNFQNENIHGVSNTQIYEFLRWAKSEKIKFCTTQKTTRGIILKVNNYERFQDPQNYKNQNTSQNPTKIDPKQTQNRPKTIIKELIKKELINLSLSELCEQKNISKREREILKNFLKRDKSVRNPSALLKVIIANDDYVEILEDEKKRIKREYSITPIKEVEKYEPTEEEKEYTRQFLANFKKKLQQQRIAG